MAKNNSAWKKIGSLRKSEKGGLYLKLDEDITLNAGDNVLLQDPRKSLDMAVEAGRMNLEKAEEIKGKLPVWLKYDLVLPPKK
jgi:hypothetical protein